VARGGARIRVEGARELRRALKQAGDDATDLKDLHHEVGEVVVSEAKTIVPRLSGTLANTIRSSRAKGAAIVRAGQTSIPYAGVIHFGWPGHNIEPQPFLYDAVDARRDEVIRLYEERVAEIAAKV
jgi:hypothetical protein